MSDARITGLDVVWFTYDLPDLGEHPSLHVPIYTPGATYERKVYVVRIHTDTGITGEYVGDRGADATNMAPLARMLQGRDALAREGFFDEARRASLIGGHTIGLGVVDCALWDLAGKLLDAPAFELLGGHPRRLPCYASTHVGDDQPDGLSTPEAYADLAELCLELGYPGFKIHPWPDRPISDQIALVRAVGERVGGRMDLMIDPFNAIPTFGETVRLGRACDEYGFLWIEDPFRDGGVSIHAHRKLRQLIRTPVLQLEHVRGLEAHVDFTEGGGTDFVRLDPDYDGVTGTVKIAHAVEGFGLDGELHGSGPVRRQLMAAIGNTNYYEMSLVHPKLGPFHPPVHLDFEDTLEAVDGDGCCEVPTGPGLGVVNDWDFIDANTVDRVEFR